MQGDRPTTNTKRGDHGRILRGFTLIELVMVVGILSILAAVAIPRVANSLALNRVEAAANRVAGDLRLAQRHARLASAEQRVLFDSGNASYQFVGLADRDKPGQTYTVRLTEAPYEVGISSAKFGKDAEICFDGHGVPDSRGAVELVAGEFWASVKISADGEITMESGSDASTRLAEAIK